MKSGYIFLLSLFIPLFPAFGNGSEDLLLGRSVSKAQGEPTVESIATSQILIRKNWTIGEYFKVGPNIALNGGNAEGGLYESYRDAQLAVHARASYPTNFFVVYAAASPNVLSYLSAKGNLNPIVQEPKSARSIEYSLSGTIKGIETLAGIEFLFWEDVSVLLEYSRSRMVHEYKDISADRRSGNFAHSYSEKPGLNLISSGNDIDLSLSDRRAVLIGQAIRIGVSHTL